MRNSRSLVPANLISHRGLALTLVVAMFVGAWTTQHSASDAEPFAPRSMVQIMDEIDSARVIAEACQIVIDKPPRCLP